MFATGVTGSARLFGPAAGLSPGRVFTMLQGRAPERLAWPQPAVFLPAATIEARATVFAEARHAVGLYYGRRSA